MFVFLYLSCFHFHFGCFSFFIFVCSFFFFILILVLGVSLHFPLFLFIPFKCIKRLSRTFVSRTSLARTCVSVTSHLVQVVSVPRSFLVLLLFLKFMEEKSASPFQEDVSLLQERVRLHKQNCDRREEEHTRALDDLRQAESKVQDVKSQASIMEVWRAAPLFQVLHRQQAKLKKAHHNLKFLTDKVSESKSFVQQRHQGP